MVTVNELGLVRGTKISTIKYGSGSCNAFDRYNNKRVYAEFKNRYDLNPITGNVYEWISTDEIIKTWSQENGWVLGTA